MSPESKNSSQNIDASILKPRIDAINLTAYGSRRSKGVFGRKKILENISLSISGGEFVAIIGPSGAGKTTLINLLSGELSHNHKGKVRLYNIPYDTMIRPGAVIGHLHQENIVPGELSILDSLLLTAKIRRPFESKKNIKKLVKFLLKETKIDGYERIKVSELSGGEERRVNLCAELISDPIFLFLDEPTANLDGDTTEEILLLLKDFIDDNHSIVLITHTTDPENWRLFDRIIFIAEGQLIFDGNPSDIMKFLDVENPKGIFAKTKNLSIEELEDLAKKWRKFSKKQEVGFSENINNENYYLWGLWELWPKSLSIQLRHFSTIFQRDVKTLLYNMQDLLLFIIQPVIFAFLIILLSPSDILLKGHNRPSGIFSDNGGFDYGPLTLVGLLPILVALMGLIDSHREIVKERTIYRQEQRAGLLPVPYVLSKLFFIYTISLFQLFILLSVIGWKVKYPPSGLILKSAKSEIYITLALCMIANVNIGFIVSAISKTAKQATMLLTPILAIEIALGGLLINEPKGVIETVSRLVPTYWTYQSLGTIVDINNFPEFSLLEPSRLFGYTTEIANEISRCENLVDLPEKCQGIINYNFYLANHLSYVWIHLVVLSILFGLILIGIMIYNRWRMYPKHISIVRRKIISRLEHIIQTIDF